MPFSQAQYEAVCQECDALLADPAAEWVRVANPWLHVIREHPAFLVQYEALFTPGYLAWMLERVRRRARHTLATARQAVRAMRARDQPWVGSATLAAQADVVFISHLINPGHIGQADDFYFGRLPADLAARGYSVVVVLIDQTRSSRPAQSLGAWDASPVPRVVLGNSFTPAGEWRIQRAMREDAARLRSAHPSDQRKGGLSARVRSLAADEALSNGTRGALRIAAQIETLATRLQPRMVLTTFEGHAWERLAFAAARTAVPDVQCLAYQHAALFRLQHALRRPLGLPFDPDHILTPGEVSRRQLTASPGMHGVPVSTVGSNRSFFPIAASTIPRTDACLVIPEGIVSECRALFDFTLQCARSNPGLTFIWRLHPILSFDKLTAANPAYRSLPSNIEMSKATLNEDLARCRWALYRGTTTIIQAVMAGLQPIYLALPGEMSIDPLYELGAARHEVTTPEDLHRACSHGADVATDSGRELVDYCRGFYTPLAAEPLIQLLGAPRGKPAPSGRNES